MVYGPLKFKYILAALLGLTQFCGLCFADSTKSTHQTYFPQTCSHFETSRDFVRSSSLYCMQHRNERQCTKEAYKFFHACKYKGDYTALRQEMRTAMMLMFVFAKATVKGS